MHLSQQQQQPMPPHSTPCQVCKGFFAGLLSQYFLLVLGFLLQQKERRGGDNVKHMDGWIMVQKHRGY